jgi:psp operon transcriptional activator
MSENRTVQPIIGEAPAFLAMLEHVSRAAPLSKPVLVVGERGTGKELISSRLHFLSSRWEQPLVKVNCAALTETILESELFGHEAGAFTGAIRAHVGHFERADGGTLVLDELATISLRMQEKILRVIEYGELLSNMASFNVLAAVIPCMSRYASWDPRILIFRRWPLRAGFVRTSSTGSHLMS